MPRKEDYARLLLISAAELRDEQERERVFASRAASDATGQSSLLDIAVGRQRQYALHIEEASRAFREGEAATDDTAKRRWYARAILEYRDARRAAGEDLKEGPSVVQTAKAGGKAVSDAVGSIWDSIPSWAKWGALGAGVVYVAGPYLLPSGED